MKLKILLPTQVLLAEDVEAVNAEAQNGAFGLLPQHIDFVTALVPCILSYMPSSGGDEVFVAIDEGILVKCGDETLVSVRNAVLGEGLDTLEQTVEEKYAQLNEKEKQSRSAIARLEAGFMRRLTEQS
jgi:F-type H+-transporting ATPase subunit epsilon